MSDPHTSTMREGGAETRRSKQERGLLPGLTAHQRTSSLENCPPCSGEAPQAAETVLSLCTSEGHILCFIDITNTHNEGPVLTSE